MWDCSERICEVCGCFKDVPRCGKRPDADAFCSCECGGELSSFQEWLEFAELVPDPEF